MNLWQKKIFQKLKRDALKVHSFKLLFETNKGSSGICLKIKALKVKFTKILTIKKNKVIKFWRVLNVS